MAEVAVRKRLPAGPTPQLYRQNPSVSRTLFAQDVPVSGPSSRSDRQGCPVGGSDFSRALSIPNLGVTTLHWFSGSVPLCHTAA